MTRPWVEISREEAHREARRLYEQLERDKAARIAAPIRRRASRNFRYIRRKLLRMNKSRVARVCGVSRNTVRRWEDPSCAALPDVGHIGALFDGMDYTLANRAAMICGQKEAPKDGRD